jgi:hypothetical protein
VKVPEATGPDGWDCLVLPRQSHKEYVKPATKVLKDDLVYFEEFNELVRYLKLYSENLIGVQQRPKMHNFSDCPFWSLISPEHLGSAYIHLDRQDPLVCNWLR